MYLHMFNQRVWSIHYLIVKGNEIETERDSERQTERGRGRQREAEGDSERQRETVRDRQRVQ